MTHRSRAKPGVHAAPLVARWCALVMCGTSVLVLISVGANLTGDDHRALVGVLAVAGLAVGVAVNAMRDHVSKELLAWGVLPVAIVAFAIGLGLVGDPTNPAATFFVVGAALSGYVFPAAVARLHLATMAIAYATVLAILEPSWMAVDRWFITMSAAALTMVVVLRLRDHLVEQAATDPLTGALTRGAFDVMFDDQLRVAQATGQPLSLLLVDLDHFKAINDSSGHLAGYAALHGVAEAVTFAARGARRVGRIGGDEFAVVIPAADSTAGLRCAGEITARIRALGIPVTVSVGVATAPHNGLTPEALLQEADAALYTAKRAGRGRAVAAPQPEAVLV